MHQLDKLISARCASFLKEKDDQVKFLQHSLAERDAEVNGCVVWNASNLAIVFMLDCTVEK